MVAASSVLASSFKALRILAFTSPRLISTEVFEPKSLTCLTPNSDNCSKEIVLIDEERSRISLSAEPVCSSSFWTMKAGLPNSDNPLDPSPASACKTVPKTAVFSAITDAPSDGDSYAIGPKIVISGDGQGANARATVNSSGAINAVTVVAGGNNYSNASITVIANGSQANSYNPTTATLTPVIGPAGGYLEKKYTSPLHGTNLHSATIRNFYITANKKSSNNRYLKGANISEVTFEDSYVLETDQNDEVVKKTPLSDFSPSQIKQFLTC